MTSDDIPASASSQPAIRCTLARAAAPCEDEVLDLAGEVLDLADLWLLKARGLALPACDLFSVRGVLQSLSPSFHRDSSPLLAFEERADSVITTSSVVFTWLLLVLLVGAQQLSKLNEEASPLILRRGPGVSQHRPTAETHCFSARAAPTSDSLVTHAGSAPTPSLTARSFAKWQQFLEKMS